MAKRVAARLTVSELIAEASDVSRGAWRAGWAPILLLTLAHTVIFLDRHVAHGGAATGLMTAAACALMIFYVPLYGALYRLALGGRIAGGRGVGGLQWDGVEWRLIAVGVVIAFVTGLVLMPFLAATGVIALVIGLDRTVPVDLLGPTALWKVLCLPVWLLCFVVMAARVSRLMLGWAYSSAREKAEPFAGWAPSKRSGWSIAWALLVCWTPLLIGYLGVLAFSMIEADALAPQIWPLPEAILAGIVLGLIKTAVVAPLSVGVLCGAYWLLEEREAQPAMADAGADDAAIHAAPAQPQPVVPQSVAPEADASEGFQPLSPWPHSALPPWPEHPPQARAAHESFDAARAAGKETSGEPIAPLAPRHEPEHRFVEITEQD